MKTRGGAIYIASAIPYNSIVTSASVNSQVRPCVGINHMLWVFIVFPLHLHTGDIIAISLPQLRLFSYNPNSHHSF